MLYMIFKQLFTAVYTIAYGFALISIALAWLLFYLFSLFFRVVTTIVTGVIMTIAILGLLGMISMYLKRSRLKKNLIERD